MGIELTLKLIGIASPLILLAGILLGYWMGRNAIGKPFNEFNPPRHQEKQPPKDKTQPLIEYDPWAEALRDPKLDLKNTVE